MSSWYCALIGLFAGALGGLFGIGGGIIIVPALVWFLGYSQHRAQGTSLVMLVLPVGILGAINYYKAGNADIKAATILALGFFGGSLLGSKLALNLSPEIMRKSFAVFLLLIAIQLFFKKG